jgi:hypothetical protein
MPELLAASNVAVPPLAQLVGALRRRGVAVGDGASPLDPDTLADRLAAQFIGRTETMQR